MPRSASSDSSHNNENRTILPPIRDLFGEELSRSPRPPSNADPRYSPSASLARLNLRGPDEDNKLLYDRYAYSTPPRQQTTQSYEHPHGYAGHSALGLSSVPPPPSLSSARSHSPSLPLPFASSFPPDRPSSTNLYPSSTHPPHLADHSRSKSLSEAQAPHSLRSQYPPPYPERQYHTSSSRPGSSLNPEVDWHNRGASASHPQQYTQSGSLYGRYPYGTPGGQALDSATGSSGRGRSGSDTGIDRSASGKYECQYCGKGFNRPSSLKIHINSHTGERPFTCPHEGCGRTFSVLSNMRRHARAHAQSQGSVREGSGDDATDGESYSPPMPMRPSLSSSTVGTSASLRAYPYPAPGTQTTGSGSPEHRSGMAKRGSDGGSRSRSISSEEDVQTPQGPSRGYPGRD
ncbi:hypothetical protein NEOLEDRAFT_204275 [Neolentinus lepideus HHB14362 ss-1]|uniref:C2H2-type domain-containing protein n=1 Tax=Neolentinus lepideus HHB14362 ss-1 TaxID=1314782 RepID=A0A165TIT5_9AGAM|nr:hypothetical protein NEOLEDRAFT_204275 [Neolentinus lepideus HHB14362 ss-1]